MAEKPSGCFQVPSEPLPSQSSLHYTHYYYYYYYYYYYLLSVNMPPRRVQQSTVEELMTGEAGQAQELQGQGHRRSR
jgi:hypothetical protein